MRLSTGKNLLQIALPPAPIDLAAFDPLEEACWQCCRWSSQLTACSEQAARVPGRPAVCGGPSGQCCAGAHARHSHTGQERHHRMYHAHEACMAVSWAVQVAFSMNYKYAAAATTTARPSVDVSVLHALMPRLTKCRRLSLTLMSPSPSYCAWHWQSDRHHLALD